MPKSIIFSEPPPFMGIVFLCKPLQKAPLYPQTCMYELQQGCNTCRKRIRYSDSISLCRCYMFTHKKCFLQYMKPYTHPKLEYFCPYCHARIQLITQFTYTLTIKNKWKQFLALFLSLILLFILFLMLEMEKIEPLTKVVCNFLFGFFVVAEGISMLIILVEGKVKKQDVKATEVSLRKEPISIDFIETLEEFEPKNQEYRNDDE